MQTLQKRGETSSVDICWPQLLRFDGLRPASRDFSPLLPPSIHPSFRSKRHTHTPTPLFSHTDRQISSLLTYVRGKLPPSHLTVCFSPTLRLLLLLYTGRVCAAGSRAHRPPSLRLQNTPPPHRVRRGTDRGMIIRLSLS